MRTSHFHASASRCPACRHPEASPALQEICEKQDPHIIQALLRCTNPACPAEYPVIDGLPVLVPRVADYVRDQMHTLYARDDLDLPLDSLIGDCCGPGVAFEAARQQVSSYAWDHYGMHDPDEAAEDPRPGSALRNLDTMIADTGIQPEGPVLELGCSVGGVSLTIAERFETKVLGIDLNYAMLRLAGRVLRKGAIRYDRKRIGLVYERRSFPVPVPAAEAGQVDFWVADASALPFADSVFPLIVALNFLDSAPTPITALQEISRCLAPGGYALISAPWDWSGAAPIEGWIGGHSQRGELQGEPGAVLRSLLDPGNVQSPVRGLAIEREWENLPWQVRLHERSFVQYRAHGLALRKI